MASISTVSIPSPTNVVTQQKSLPATGHRPMSFSARNPRKTRRRLEARASASTKEKVVSVATAAAMAAVLAVPEVAEAAGPGVSPSLKNFLLSIAAGGVVVAVIVGAVVGVANFDPVKRS